MNEYFCWTHRNTRQGSHAHPSLANRVTVIQYKRSHGLLQRECHKRSYPLLPRQHVTGTQTARISPSQRETHLQWDKLCTGTTASISHPSPFWFPPCAQLWAALRTCASPPPGTPRAPVSMGSRIESPRPTPHMPEALPHAPAPHAPCPRRMRPPAHHSQKRLAPGSQRCITHTVDRLHLRQSGRAQPRLTAPTWSSPAAAYHCRPPPREAVRQWCF